MLESSRTSDEEKRFAPDLAAGALPEVNPPELPEFPPPTATSPPLPPFGVPGGVVYEPD